MQIVAKMGGTPWAINDLPLMDKPTMICGYDVWRKKRVKSVLAFNATMNKQATRYWQTSIEQEDEIASGLEEILDQAL